jgi:hypothetical protein
MCGEADKDERAMAMGPYSYRHNLYQESAAYSAVSLKPFARCTESLKLITASVLADGERCRQT